MELNDLMEFDHVIQVLPGGGIIDAPADVYAPDLHDGELGGEGWTFLDGFSGQQGYSGPLMHQSEFVGGGMETYIREHPGLYVTLVNYLYDEEEPTEWAVAFRP